MCLHAIFEQDRDGELAGLLSGSLPERCAGLVEFSGELFASMNRQVSGAELS